MFEAAVNIHEAAKQAAEGERYNALMAAVAEYNKILEVKPGDLDTHYNVGNALSHAAEVNGLPLVEVHRLLDGAAQSFARVLKLDTSGRAEVRPLVQTSLANTLATRAQKEEG